jgi:hypothetical protein
LVDIYLGFAQNSFQKWQTVCRFSKEFCENPGNESTNRKKGIKLQKRIVTFCLQKSSVNSKAFGVKRLRNNKLNIILNGEAKKY